jgi:hypothetical protein
LKAGQVADKEGLFSVQMQLRAAKIMRPKDVEATTKAAVNLFKTILAMNGVAHHAWPPTLLEVNPHGDFCGLELTVGTLAQEPQITVRNLGAATMTKQ